MDQYMFAMNLENIRNNCMRMIKTELNGNDYDTPMFETCVIDRINEFFKKNDDVMKQAIPLESMDEYTTNHKIDNKDRKLWTYNQVIDFLDDYTDKIKSDNDLEYDVVFMDDEM